MRTDSRLRRPYLLVATLSVLACLSAVTGSGANGGTDRCVSPDSRTVVANEYARIFVKQEPSPKAGRYYGCHRRSGRKTLLSQEPSGDIVYSVGRFRLAGALAAYERVKSTGISRGAHPERQIFVRDLVTARISRRLQTGEVRGAAFAEPEPKDGVRDLVVSWKGDVAWIVHNPFALRPPEPNVNRSSRTTEVYVAPRGEAPRLLDQGDGIADTSLTRSGCAISWVRDGARRQDTLCP